MHASLLAVLLLVACAGEPPNETSTAIESAAEAPDSQTGIDVEPATRSATTSAQGVTLGSFSRKRAMRHVRKLAGEIGIRERATPGERRGARYIAERFRAYGYEVKIQKFSVDGGTSRNVVAWLPDSRRYPVIVGGHMDSVPGAPGANDNASGTAVVLEIARLVANKEQGRYVRFVAFGSEEYGDDGRHHVGSEVFVRRLGDEGRKRLAGMVSVDMIADGRPLIVGNSGIASDVVARALFRKIDNANIAVRYETACDCSDNGPFEHAGIPASYAWSGDEPNYHDPSDTVANMKPKDLLRTGRAIRAFVRQLDQAMLDKFRSRR